MTNPLARLSLLWKIMLSTSVAITLLFALAGWIAIKSATRATSLSVNHEVQASFKAYQSLWKARADRLSSICAILGSMSDVRAAFGTGDEATIRDTASELWSRVSRDDAFFLVATPQGRVIASLGGLSKEQVPDELPVVGEALSHFPAQASGFLVRGAQLYHITVTPVYVQTTGGTALLNVLVAGYEVNRTVAGRLKSATGESEYLFLSGDGVVATTLEASDAPLIARQISASLRPVRAGGSEYAPLITPLTDINGRPVGKLAILRSFDAANREIAALRSDIGLLWLVSMIAGLALTYVPARRLVRPVKELDRAATEVARQNYDCEVPVRSQDELGRLAATFNAMCASIRQAREELIRSERITTIGRLATSIVHDLRNPLAAIYGGAEMLAGSDLSEADVKRLARSMYRASLHIQELLQDLLEVGRGKTGKLRPCKLRDIAAGAVESLAAAAAARSVKVTLDVPQELELPLDRRLIGRLFANLIGNSLEAMPGGGAIDISAAVEGETVLVQVRDNGPGISPEIRSRLFQPFATAGKSKGLGLGLALSRQVVLDHGGDMWVDSSPGRGACFSIRLPAHIGTC